MKHRLRLDIKYGLGSTFSLGLLLSHLLFLSGVPSAFSAEQKNVPEKPVHATREIVKISSADGKVFLKSFLKAQQAEIRSLEKKQKAELSELYSTQKTRFKDWKKRETDERHHFFSSNKKGSERRTYVKEFSDRRETLLKMQAEEYAQRVRENQVHLDSLKSEQGIKLKEFKQALDRGDRPEGDLWPKGAAPQN